MSIYLARHLLTCSRNHFEHIRWCWWWPELIRGCWHHVLRECWLDVDPNWYESALWTCPERVLSTYRLVAVISCTRRTNHRSHHRHRSHRGHRSHCSPLSHWVWDFVEKRNLSSLQSGIVVLNLKGVLIPDAFITHLWPCGYVCIKVLDSTVITR